MQSPYLKLLRESVSLISVSRECRASTGSLRRPAVPKRKMGVLSHCCPGTTASAHSSKGPSALVVSPACKHALIHDLPVLTNRGAQCGALLV